MDEIRVNYEEVKNELKTKDGVINWLNQNLTIAQTRDPGFRMGPPPQGVHFSPRVMTSTSTPMPRT